MSTATVTPTKSTRPLRRLIRRAGAALRLWQADRMVQRLEQHIKDQEASIAKNKADLGIYEILAMLARKEFDDCR